MKISEIRKAYETLSGTFSKTARALALSGIAIAWLFMPYFEKNRNMRCFIILAICVFVIMILCDLLQNYYLSKTWYAYYIRMKEDFGKDENTDVKEDEKKNSFAWLLYDIKFYLLIVGYVLLAIGFFLIA